MAGLIFIVNVPKKEYEIGLRENNIPTIIYDKEKYEISSKVINELKEKQQETKSFDSYIKDSSYYIKCQSTDCLSFNKNDAYKCNSEIELGKSCESFPITSWEDGNQSVSSANKLKITKPTLCLDILEALKCDAPLETILSEIVSRLEIKNSAWSSTMDNTFWQVIFSMESGKICEDILQVLETFGIGSRSQSSVSLLPCTLYYKSNEPMKNLLLNKETNFDSSTESSWTKYSSSSVRDRINLAQVLHDVRANARLTFDWLFLLLIAAFVAAVGLVENSITILVASMLISPLMGPVTAGTLGTALQNRSLQMMGVINEFLGLFISLVMGFIVGLSICILDEKYEFIEDWPTEEMLSRCAHRSLWVGILVAIPSGAGCALAVLGDYTASLVGVAISATLLPPAVNAGILWAMSLTRLLMPSEEHHWLIVLPSELALLGTASLCLTLVNIICIFLSGVAVYKLKEVKPLGKTGTSSWKGRGRFNNTRQKAKDKLEWDAYTIWCTNSLERKEKKYHANNVKNSGSESVGKNSIMEPSFLRRLRDKSLEEIGQRVQLSGNFSPLKSNIGKDIEKQLLTQQKCSPAEDVETSHVYQNFSYEPISSSSPADFMEESIYSVIHSPVPEVQL